MQLSIEAAVSVRIRSTGSERLSRRLEPNNQKKPPSFSMQEIDESFLEIIAEKGDILLRLTDYNVCKENLERQGEHKKVVRGSVLKVVKIVAILFVGMEICIIRAVAKQFLKEKSELDYFKEDLR